MAYKCPECGQTSEQMGNCPNCNVPMSKEAAAANEETAPETTHSRKNLQIQKNN